MVSCGDCDFVHSLAKLLEISRSTASVKLNGRKPFSQKEIVIIAKKYDLSPEEIYQIFVGGD